MSANRFTIPIVNTKVNAADPPMTNFFLLDTLPAPSARRSRPSCNAEAWMSASRCCRKLREVLDAERGLEPRNLSDCILESMLAEELVLLVLELIAQLAISR